jgi:hypothetical protein
MTTAAALEQHRMSTASMSSAHAHNLVCTSTADSQSTAQHQVASEVTDDGDGTRTSERCRTGELARPGVAMAVLHSESVENGSTQPSPLPHAVVAAATLSSLAPPATTAGAEAEPTEASSADRANGDDDGDGNNEAAMLQEEADLESIVHEELVEAVMALRVRVADTPSNRRSLSGGGVKDALTAELRAAERVMNVQARIIATKVMGVQAAVARVLATSTSPTHLDSKPALDVARMKSATAALTVELKKAEVGVIYMRFLCCLELLYQA